jgi:hypothetical protein
MPSYGTRQNSIDYALDRQHEKREVYERLCYHKYIVQYYGGTTVVAGISSDENTSDYRKDQMAAGGIRGS